MSASALKSAGAATTDLAGRASRARSEPFHTLYSPRAIVGKRLVPRTDGDGNVHVERHAGELRKDDLSRRPLQAGAQRALVDVLPVDPRRGHLSRWRYGGGDMDLAYPQGG